MCKSFVYNFNKINGCNEDDDGSKHLTLIYLDENKDEIKMYKETWSKIKILLIRKIMTTTNMMINTPKSDLIQILIYH